MTTQTDATNQAIADSMNETDTINHVDEIEAVIGTMALDQKVMAGESDGSHVWKFHYGSVEVFVQLTGTTDEDTLTVWSPVLKLPAKDEAKLMQKLLEMNWMTTYESHFAIFNNQVVIVATRTVADLSPGEMSRLITIVATLADDNDDALQAEFGN